MLSSVDVVPVISGYRITIPIQYREALDIDIGNKLVTGLDENGNIVIKTRF